jgi:2-dehydro-3-deoxyphosphogluconate aldolase / (4S)-4-hydroxy-2-oxoglutarate aldolase
MNRLARKEINELVDKHAFLPLFNPDNLEVSRQIVKAAYDGGVRLFELTNRTENALDIFKEIIPYARQTMPDMVIGVGSIIDEKSAADFYDAGAAFIVSPIVSQEVAGYCERNKIFWVPGAATLTEVVYAHQLGADMVKIFPANYLGGPGFLEAIKAPCPWIRIMPTGGVEGTEENLKAWFKAGARCVGIGSQLFKKDWIASGDYTQITNETNRILTIIQKIRSGKK